MCETDRIVRKFAIGEDSVWRHHRWAMGEPAGSLV